MAEYRDFFKLAHDDSYDKQPLVKLRDNDRIPDLRKYTMGDLRSWVAENSPGLPSVLPKGVIRASSQLANGVVTSSKILDGTIATSDLADKAITPDKIDWAQMPAVPVAQWINHSTVVGPTFGYNMPTTGTWQSMAASWLYVDVPSVLPARAGYVRRYSLRMQLTANTGSVAGITGGYWQFKSNSGSTVWTTPTLYAGSGPGEVGWASAWIAAPDWDAALGYLHLQILGQANTGFTSAVRHVQILGRYV